MMYGWACEPTYENPADSVFIITGRTETVTVSDAATMLGVSRRLEQHGPITIREVFPDGSGRWIVPPAGCGVDIVKPPGPPVAQPEPEPEGSEPRPGWHRAQTLVERYQETIDYDPESYELDGYEARVWYWLVHNANFSKEAAAKQVRLNIDTVEQSWRDDVDAYELAKQLARLGYGQRIRPRRRRRPTWECPMPQTLLVAGIDVIAETKRLIAVVPELYSAPMPSIYVRRNTKLRQRYGSAILTRNHIRLTDAPEIDRFEVIDTLSHELAHLNVFRLYQEKGHGQPWRDALEHIALHGYGVSIKVKTRYSSELAQALREQRRRGT